MTVFELFKYYIIFLENHKSQTCMYVLENFESFNNIDNKCNEEIRKIYNIGC